MVGLHHTQSWRTYKKNKIKCVKGSFRLDVPYYTSVLIFNSSLPTFTHRNNDVTQMRINLYSLINHHILTLRLTKITRTKVKQTHNFGSKFNRRKAISFLLWTASTSLCINAQQSPTIDFIFLDSVVPSYLESFALLFTTGNQFVQMRIERYLASHGYHSKRTLICTPTIVPSFFTP